MNKIQIVNWLLTRKCNLNCDYCRIVKNYENKPNEYPDIKYYRKNEMSTKLVIDCLRRLKLHNPDCFHILYGGEPTLRYDLSEIINYCNKNEIHYTIISNNSVGIQPLMKELLEKVDYIEGFTASIDPIIYQNVNNDIFKKSFEGLKKLTEYSGIIKDVVAEITVTNENLEYLYPLVKELTSRGINSDITFIDIAKTNYYDFSDITDESLMVYKSEKLKDILDKIISEKLNVHMSETLLPMIYKILPSEMVCTIDKDFHNMTIDADGSIRLCLRCRGVSTPLNFNTFNILDDEGILNKYLQMFIYRDKTRFCQKCNHTCLIMSELLSNGNDTSDSLVHSDIRSK